MLDDLEQTRPVFAFGQSIENRRIDNDRQRLVKAADQVLPGCEIYAGLSTHGRVHLRQQSGRHLNHRNAAHKNGGQESRDVRKNAAAECNDNAGSIAAARHHLLGQRLHFGQALARFAARKKQNLGFAQRSRQRRAVQFPNVFGRDQKNLAGALGDVVAHVREAAALNQHRVAAMWRLDEIGRHTIVVPCGYRKSPPIQKS